MNNIKILLLLLLTLVTLGCSTTQTEANIEYEDVDGIEMVINEIDELSDSMYDDQN